MERFILSDVAQPRNRPDNMDSDSTILAALEDEPPYDGTTKDGRPYLPLTSDPYEGSEDEPQYSDRSPSHPPRRRRLVRQFDVATCESVSPFRIHFPRSARFYSLESVPWLTN